MKDYFERQIRWFEAMLSEYEEAQRALDAGNIDRVEELQRRFTVESLPLGEEFASLRREWDATPDLTGADRDAIRRLADEAGVLCNTLQARFETGAATARQQADAMQESFAEIKRGKAVLDKYRVQGDPRFVDRRA